MKYTNINPRKPKAIIDVPPGAVGYLGCSGLAAPLGLSDYTTRRQAYLRFWGLNPPPTDEQQEVFDRGHRAEGFIAKEIEVKYKVKLRQVKGAYVHPKYDWWICHPDRLLVGRVDGKRIGVEIKSSSVYTSFKWGEENSSEIPMDYLLQCFGYLACGVCDEVWLFRYSDWRLTRYIIRYDEGRIAVLEEKLVPVIESYLRKEEPAPSTYAECNEVWHDPKEDLVASKELVDMCVRYKALKDTEKDVKEQLDKLKTDIVLLMGGKKRILDQDGKRLYSNIHIEREDIDSKRLKEELPEVYSKYVKKSEYFQFR